jgi:hypothetical protein
VAGGGESTRNVCDTASRKLGFISVVLERYSKVKEMSYFALIIPHLEYAASIVYRENVMQYLRLLFSETTFNLLDEIVFPYCDQIYKNFEKIKLTLQNDIKNADGNAVSNYRA